MKKHFKNEQRRRDAAAKRANTNEVGISNTGNLYTSLQHPLTTPIHSNYTHLMITTHIDPTH